MEADLTVRKGKAILGFLDFEQPTAEQEQALLAMADFVAPGNTEDFLILSGAAGTGKTSISKALIQYLNSEKISHHIAAPTGRAARILGKKAGAASTTIHSLIYHPVSDPNSGAIIFNLKDNTEENFTVFILDEASMISSVIVKDDLGLFISKNSLLNDLVRFAKKGNSKNKLIFLGDRNQLPPVFEEFSRALSKEYMEQTYQLTGSGYQLTEVKRQQKDSYILRNAVTIRECIDNEMPAEELRGVENLPIALAALNYAEEYKENGFEGSISIAASHNMNRVFNEWVRSILFGDRAELVVPEDLLLVTSTWKRNGKELFSGDHVIVEEINLNAIEEVAGLQFAPVKLRYKNLKNEDEILKDYLLLECITHPKGLKADQERRLRAERFKVNETYQKSGNPAEDTYVGAIRCTYGYSITCHKAQGGEWKKVYINSFFMPSLRYQYTAITRAREELVLY